MSYFKCIYCGKSVSLTAPGTKNRNHCSFCLASKHVDIEIGDRANECGGCMLAIGKFLKPDGEEVIVHKCQVCGNIRKNRIAGDDDWGLVGKLPLVSSF